MHVSLKNMLPFVSIPFPHLCFHPFIFHDQRNDDVCAPSTSDIYADQQYVNTLLRTTDNEIRTLEDLAMFVQREVVALGAKIQRNQWMVRRDHGVILYQNVEEGQMESQCAICALAQTR